MWLLSISRPDDGGLIRGARRYPRICYRRSPQTSLSLDGVVSERAWTSLAVHHMTVREGWECGSMGVCGMLV